MKIDTELRMVILAHNVFFPQNPYILLEKSGELPEVPLQPKRSLIYLSRKKVEEIFGISGHWVEMTPVQVGVFEDLTADRLIVVYLLTIPEKAQQGDGYEWRTVDGLNGEIEAIVRFSVGDKYVQPI